MVVTTRKNGKGMVNPGMKESLSSRELEILRLIKDGKADKEIASQLHLSLNTVKWHNRQIYAKLGVSNRTQAVSASRELGLLEGGEIPEKPTSRIPHNLPAPISSFVGREREIQEIIDLLKTNRLLTLTGPGGVGKTRLALETARSLLAEGNFTEGIFFVELAPLFQPDRVVEAIRESAGIQSNTKISVRDLLHSFFKEKRVLLILDNFEHLLKAAPLVCELLESHSGLRIMNTSREELGLSGEQLFRVPPLELTSSVTLFTERTKESRFDFRPGEKDLELVKDICQQLDGLPLALELAATRMKVLQLEELRDRLSDRFNFLTRMPRDVPERHKSLQATIDWSYDLLSEDECILFRRLAVFQGSRHFNAIEAICCFDLELDVLDGMESLYSKSLIKEKQGRDQEPRFLFLDTIQEYAIGRLQESGELEEIQERHARYFVELIEEVKHKLWRGSEQFYWRARVEEDFDNIRAIFSRTLSQGVVEYGLRLVAALEDFWIVMDHCQEGLDWVEWALENSEEAPPDVQAGVFDAAGSILFAFYEYQRSKSCFEQAIEYYQFLGNKRGLGWAHIQILPMIFFVDGDDPIQVMHHASQGFALLEEVGDIRGVAAGWMYLAMHGSAVENYRLVVHASVKRFRIGQELDDPILLLAPIAMIGACQLSQGRPKISEACFKKWLSWVIALSRKDPTIYEILFWLSGTALAQGKLWRAAVLQGAGDRLRSEREGVLDDGLGRFQFELIRRQIAEQLSKEDYAAARTEGHSLSFAEIIDFALEDGEPEGLIRR